MQHQFACDRIFIYRRLPHSMPNRKEGKWPRDFNILGKCLPWIVNSWTGLSLSWKICLLAPYALFYKIQYPCTWLMNIDYRHSNWHNKIMVGEYLMVFQNNTCNKFTIAQNWTLFFHQWLSGDIGYSSVQALHSRLASCECERFRLPNFWPLQKKFSKPSFSLLTFGYHFRSTSFLLFGRAARYRPPPPSPAFESPLACLSCVYFSRYPPKG